MHLSLFLILKAFFIGSTMTIPGVSGGTMAVITGIYENLISAINGLRKDLKKHIIFLLQFAISALVGFVLFAGIVTNLLESPKTGTIIRIVFVVIVLAGIPTLVKKSNIKKIQASHLFCLIIGAAIVLSISRLPVGLFSSGTGASYIIMQFIGGVIVAIALILPGISVSHMLYILGLYKPVMENVYSFNWFILIPLFLGIIIGIFATTNILEKLLDKYTDKVYMLVIGFVSASISSLLI